MSNLGATAGGAVDVKLVCAADVAHAIAAFLADAAPAEGFAHQTIGAYRALCRARDPLLLVLLAAGDGALYVLPAAGAEVEAALRALRYRPTTTTLALRLPEPLGSGTATYVLWASPRYLAAGTGSEQVWK